MTSVTLAEKGVWRHLTVSEGYPVPEALDRNTGCTEGLADPFAQPASVLAMVVTPAVHRG